MDDCAELLRFHAELLRCCAELLQYCAELLRGCAELLRYCAELLRGCAELLQCVLRLGPISTAYQTSTSQRSKMATSN